MLLAPAPDPYPHTGHAPLTYVTYTYITRGETQAHRVIPGVWFRCVVPAHWRGHVNPMGLHRRCVEFRESEAA